MRIYFEIFFISPLNFVRIRAFFTLVTIWQKKSSVPLMCKQDFQCPYELWFYKNFAKIQFWIQMFIAPLFLVGSFWNFDMWCLKNLGGSLCLVFILITNIYWYFKWFFIFFLILQNTAEYWPKNWVRLTQKVVGRFGWKSNWIAFGPSLLIIWRKIFKKY